MAATTTETKVCTKCGQEKPVTEFHWKSKKEGRRRSECKVCANKKAKEYADANRELCRERNRKWAQSHRKERNAYMRKWHKAHKEADNAKSRAYYEEHREEILEQKTEYYEQNRDAIRASQNFRYHKSRKYKNLTHKQQEKLFEDNKRLVYYIAKQFEDVCYDTAMYDEMTQEGFLGLWEGIIKLGQYNPKKSALSTWMGNYVRWSILNFLNKSVNKSGLSASTGTWRRARKHRADGTESDIETRVLSSSSSIDSPINNYKNKDSDTKLSDLLGEEDELYDGLPDEIAKLLSKLDEPYRECIIRQFGIGCEPETQAEIGKCLGVSKQRVGHFVALGLARLRNTKGVKELTIYL